MVSRAAVQESQALVRALVVEAPLVTAARAALTLVDVWGSKQEQQGTPLMEVG